MVGLWSVFGLSLLVIVLFNLRYLGISRVLTQPTVAPAHMVSSPHTEKSHESHCVFRAKAGNLGFFGNMNLRILDCVYSNCTHLEHDVSKYEYFRGCESTFMPPVPHNLPECTKQYPAGYPTIPGFFEKAKEAAQRMWDWDAVECDIMPHDICVHFRRGDAKEKVRLNNRLSREHLEQLIEHVKRAYGYRTVFIESDDVHLAEDLTFRNYTISDLWKKMQLRDDYDQRAELFFIDNCIAQDMLCLVKKFSSCKIVIGSLTSNMERIMYLFNQQYVDYNGLSWFLGSWVSSGYHYDDVLCDITQNFRRI